MLAWRFAFVAAVLVNLKFTDRRENVIALGPSGTGKTHVVLGLGLAACQKGRKVGLHHRRGLGSRTHGGCGRSWLQRLQKSLATHDLLIIDKLG